ncbi:protein GVQW3-like [Mercenaria mercenaria]|uniref:protein GVQW3-like n=1 Tax=Mercenaria mercenaria TaxID=6596 RepID=UPI00234F620B|nr:protein GVQW3-like [Mercenaria mercenaria]
MGPPQEVSGALVSRLDYNASDTEIKADLDKVYGDSALPYRSIARWVSLFKEGRTSTKDEARPGCPLTAVSHKDIDDVKVIIEKDARCTVEQIKEMSGLNSSAVFLILKETLNLRIVCAGWITHLLTPEQKRERAEKASGLLVKYNNKESRRIKEIVTGDETWLYVFEPDNKENNKI